MRAVVIDAGNRVLLFRAYADRTRTRHFWITPGGGLADGESEADGLRRELGEECGLRQFEIGPQIWYREVLFPLPSTGEPLRQFEKYYLVRVDQHEVDVAGWDDFEKDFMGEHRWWTLDELQESDADFAPRRLPALLGGVLGGQIPQQPLDAGH